MNRWIGCVFFCLILLCASLLQGQQALILLSDEEVTACPSVEARRLWQDMVQSHEARISREKAELEIRKGELLALEAHVDQKIQQLRQERLAAERLFAQKDAARQKQLNTVARMYEHMAADRAAVLLSNLDQQLSLALLSRMRNRSAAKILGNMEQDKALYFSEALSSLRTY